MHRMIIGVLERFFQSYNALVIEGTNGWPLLFRILLIPVSIFFYALTLLVILSILLLVIFITVPIWAVSRIKIPSEQNQRSD
jgi:type IV secretory pathway VirB3-like protein